MRLHVRFVPSTTQLIARVKDQQPWVDLVYDIRQPRPEVQAVGSVIRKTLEVPDPPFHLDELAGPAFFTMPASTNILQATRDVFLSDYRSDTSYRLITYLPKHHCRPHVPGSWSTIEYWGRMSKTGRSNRLPRNTHRVHSVKVFHQLPIAVTPSTTPLPLKVTDIVRQAELLAWLKQVARYLLHWYEMTRVQRWYAQLRQEEPEGTLERLICGLIRQARVRKASYFLFDPMYYPEWELFDLCPDSRDGTQSSQILAGYLDLPVEEVQRTWDAVQMMMEMAE